MNQAQTWIGAVVVGTALMLGGCATVKVAEDAKGSGVTRVYDRSVPEVWAAMQVAVTRTGGAIVQTSKRDCKILATYGVSLFSWGERVAIFCAPISANRTETEVISKRAVAMNITASDWTRDIYAILDRELE